MRHGVIATASHMSASRLEGVVRLPETRTETRAIEKGILGQPNRIQWT